MDYQAVDFLSEQGKSVHEDLHELIETIAIDERRAAEDEANQIISRSAQGLGFPFDPLDLHQ